MGYYINPETEEKETFLFREGEAVTKTPSNYADIPQDRALVCLVDNGIFTAAGIVYSQRELDDWLYWDGRPKQWFAVPKDKVYSVSDIKPEHFSKV